MVFKSKLDLTFYVLFALNGIISITFCLIAKSLYSSLIVIIVFLILFLLLRSLKYTIDSKNKILHIVGLLVYDIRIPINSIIKISKENSMIAAPAASFDRLCIHTRQKVYRISPVKETVFIKSIKALNEQVIVDL